jgi:uncharacterized protein
MRVIFSLLAGALFGVGLTVADMVNPARVLGFLDFAGSWDPTLAFVMAGALGVTIVGYRLALRRDAPLIGTFDLPKRRRIDAPLVVGAAIFGVGWGLAGICPGPALADLVILEPKVLLFVIAMLAGMMCVWAMHHRVAAVRAGATHK